MAETPSSSCAEKGMPTSSNKHEAYKRNEKHRHNQVIDIVDISSTTDTDDIQDCGENKSVIKIDLEVSSDFQKKGALNDIATTEQALDKFTEEISDLNTVEKITGRQVGIGVTGSLAPDINTRDVWDDPQLITKTTEDCSKNKHFSTPSSTTGKDTYGDHMSLHIINLDSYNDGHSSDSSETNITGNTTQSTHYLDVSNGNSFSNALLISDDTGSDFNLSSPMVPEGIYQGYSHRLPISCSENVFKVHTLHYDSPTGHENPQVIPNFGDQYENIEFSTIFSTLDDYPSFQESSMLSSDSLSQDNTSSESHENLIIDLDDENHKPLISENGIFDISVTDFKPESFSIRDLQSEYCHEYSHASSLGDCEATLGRVNNNMKKECEDSEYVQYDKYTNGDGAPQYYSCQPLSVHPQSHSQVFKTADSAATSLNMYNLASNTTDWTMQDSTMYDQYIKQCYGQCSSYNHLYYKGAPRDYFPPYTDCSTWQSGGHYEPCGSRPTTAVGRPSFDTWTISAAWPKSEKYSSDSIHYSQLEGSKEDEETDDADEPEGMPSFYESPSFMPDRSPSSVALSSCSVNSSRVMAYSPATLTPPSSASSTPGPSLSQGSYTSEDIGYYSPWSKPVSFHVPSPVPVPSSTVTTNCKLSSEQLEATLLNYHAARRIFPSMADAMHNNRMSNKQKKRTDPNSNNLPRRLGRPRKNQIQSDKISTSTGRGRQRSNNKPRGGKADSGRDEPERSSEADVNEPRSSSGSSQCGRHNEPLNQRAVEIMTKWYEDNVQNPYPNKSDKESMALQGGITENQVKSWFANKRNRSNNTKPKVQKRVMEQKLRELFQDLKHNQRNPSADNTHIIQQLSGIIKRCHSKDQE